MASPGKHGKNLISKTRDLTQTKFFTFWLSNDGSEDKIDSADCSLFSFEIVLFIFNHPVDDSVNLDLI